MSDYLEEIKQHIEPLRQEIINHKVYPIIQDREDLQVFMQYHVFAVWDFMSLLKALQNNLTCTSIPWFPKGSADTRYLINEIVVGEESDVDREGNRKSHFELYLEAMQQAGADTRQIETFVDALRNGSALHEAFEKARVPQAVRTFVAFTFEIIASGKDYLQAAVFTFGREDLIPGMFLSIINDLDQQLPDSLSLFRYYLERHIEVDGDHHSQLALQMTANLCGNDGQRWQEAQQAIVRSLRVRAELWNGVYEELKAQQGRLAEA